MQPGFSTMIDGVLHLCESDASNSMIDVGIVLRKREGLDNG